MVQIFKLGKHAQKCFNKQKAHWEYVDGFSGRPATPTNQPKWDL